MSNNKSFSLTQESSDGGSPNSWKQRPVKIHSDSGMHHRVGPQKASFACWQNAVE